MKDIMPLVIVFAAFLVSFLYRRSDDKKKK